jgi:UDP-N-acetylglucosamine transferase subunit ALG13
MGMEVHPFDRLARAVDELARTGAAGEEILLQLGACTYEPRHARFQRYLSFGEVCEQIDRASVVITHAGAGSTLVCIQRGKFPVIVPRRAELGEHVDGHQLPFATKLSQGGLGVVVDELQGLAEAISIARGRTTRSGLAGGAGNELTAWLDQLWRELAERKAGHSSTRA